MRYTYLDSPIGSLLLAGDDDGLKVIGFPKGKGSRQPDPQWIADERPFKDVKRQLIAYFRGELKQFDITLCPDGTEFQLDVLTALLKIPYGETRSYGELAADLGRPNASRAVGGANANNPIPHRHVLPPLEVQHLSKNGDQPLLYCTFGALSTDDFAGG